MGYIHKVKNDDVHNVVDSESGHDYRFVIDPITRQITNKSGKVVLTKLDHNSECFTFEIPERIEGHDMSKCNVVEVHFININSATRAQRADVYPVSDGLTYDEANRVYTFKWLISQSATQYTGTLNFAVHFACYPETEGGVDKSSIPLYSWRTGIFSGISIIDSVFSGEQAIVDYSDILNEWWSRIESASTEVFAITDEGALISLTNVVDNMKTAVDEKVAELEDKVSGFETTFNEKVSGFETTFNEKVSGFETTFNEKVSGFEARFNEFENEIDNAIEDVRAAGEILYPVGTLFRTTKENGYPTVGTWKLVSTGTKNISKFIRGTTSEEGNMTDNGISAYSAIGSEDIGLGCSDVKISGDIETVNAMVNYDESTGIASWRLTSTEPLQPVSGIITATQISSPYEYERKE